MEQPMWALPPSGSEKWASMARSTPGEESFASALIDPRPGSQQAQQADRVAAHVHGGAAGQGQLVADVTLLPQRGREGHVDLGDVAELARADDLHQALGERVVLVVEGLHHDHTWVAVGRLGHGPGLVGVGGEGLLAQDVLAGPQGGDRPVPVEAVGQRVVDGVDLGVLDQRRVAVQDTRNALLTGEFGGPLAVACRHGGDDGHPRPAGRLDQGGGGDAGRSQDRRFSARGGHRAPGRLGRTVRWAPLRTFPQYGTEGSPPGTVGPDAA